MAGKGPGEYPKSTTETKTGFGEQKGANDMKELGTKAVIVGLAVTWLAAGHTLAVPGTDQVEEGRQVCGGTVEQGGASG